VYHNHSKIGSILSPTDAGEALKPVPVCAPKVHDWDPTSYHKRSYTSSKRHSTSQTAKVRTRAANVWPSMTNIPIHLQRAHCCTPQSAVMCTSNIRTRTSTWQSRQSPRVTGRAHLETTFGSQECWAHKDLSPRFICRLVVSSKKMAGFSI